MNVPCQVRCQFISNFCMSAKHVQIPVPVSPKLSLLFAGKSKLASAASEPPFSQQWSPSQPSSEGGSAMSARRWNSSRCSRRWWRCCCWKLPFLFRWAFEELPLQSTKNKRAIAQSAISCTKKMTSKGLKIILGSFFTSCLQSVTSVTCPAFLNYECLHQLISV